MPTVQGLALALVLLTGLNRADPELVRKTTQGSVQGSTEQTLTNVEYLAFRSIPYAAPPTGKLRFKLPQPAQAWEGTRQATEDGPACLQIPVFTEVGVTGEEDCLTLSVFTPSEKSTNGALRPVLVWIHGGRFLAGSARTAQYGPDYLIDRDLVVVSIQYRLGAMGFLSTGDEVAPGNYGLHDQTMALKWIQENIGTFGGDKDQVTIMGHSAGGASVHGHLVSPRSKGLFQKVIALSGTSNTAWGSRFSNHAKIAHRQAKLHNCPTESSQALIDCLQQVDAEALTASQSDLHVFFKHTPAKIPLTTFTPRQDPEAEFPFFPLDGREALRRGEYARDIPVMVGVTSQEGSWYSSTWYSKAFEPRLQEIDTLNHEDLVNLVAGEDLLEPGMWQEVVDFYFKDHSISSPASRISCSNFVSDVAFNYETLQAVHLQARQGKAPTYLFKFDYIGNWGYVNIFNETAHSFGGVSHLDDIRYLLRLAWAPPLASEEDLEMSSRYTGFVANFVKHGNPSYKQEKWESFQPGRGAYYKIDSPKLSQVMRDMPFPKARMDFMKRIFDAQENIEVDYVENGRDEL